MTSTPGSRTRKGISPGFAIAVQVWCILNGRTVDNPLNQEVTAIRGKVPGEYIVNVHYYDSESNAAVPVAVRVARVNPVYTIAYYGTTTLQHKGEEKTAVRFTIGTDGAISGINQLPISLVPRG